MTVTGVLICGHGSRDVEAVREFEAVARALAARLPELAVEHGFLEFARPILREGLERLRARGVRHVFAVPGMLFAAGHVKNDIPSVLRTYEAEHPEMRIDFGRDLSVDARLLRAARDRIREALAGAGHEKVPAHETLLMVVGRGTSDPDANGNVAKVMRMLWEGFGFGWAETAYSGVTFPLVEPALEHAARLGYRRIVVFPYFLFTGILVRRIYEHADRVAARHPEIEFVKAPYIGDHPELLEAFIERLAEVETGEGRMNCKLCKYREQIVGFEEQVGIAQASHHHHFEGIGTADGAKDGDGAARVRGDEREGLRHDGHKHDGHEHDGDEHRGHTAHGHPHGHAHPHTHHPYPHADHPHGPRSLRGSARER